MKTPVKVVLVAALFGAAVAFPFFAGAYFRSVALIILVYMSLAVSWDMLLRSGQISFGIAGFFGLGAYAAALVDLHLHVPALLSILFGAIASTLVALGLALLVLRLRGMYFAIVTLALAQIFQVVIRNWSSLSGGPEGQTLPTVIFGGDSSALYWLMLATAAVAIVCSELFERTRIRFALTTIRDNEIVAQARGVNVLGYLTLAFVVTAAIQGLVGGAYAQVYGFVTPDGSFSIDFTLLPLAMALLGGVYRTSGPVVGAIVLGVISEYLRLYVPYGSELVYGIIVIVVVLFRPRGIMVSLRARARKARAS